MRNFTSNYPTGSTLNPVPEVDESTTDDRTTRILANMKARYEDPQSYGVSYTEYSRLPRMIREYEARIAGEGH